MDPKERKGYGRKDDVQVKESFIESMANSRRGMDKYSRESTGSLGDMSVSIFVPSLGHTIPPDQQA
jgi:hypothetical protein